MVALRGSLQEEKDRYVCTAVVLCLVGYIFNAMFVTLEYETYYLLLAVCAAMARLLPVPAGLNWKDCRNIVGIVVAWLLAVQVFVVIYLV